MNELIIPRDLPYMGCQLYKPHNVKFPCLIQPKLNGIDARFYNRKFYTRTGKEWRGNVVQHLITSLLNAGVDDATMLQGQFYKHGKPLGWHISNINVNLKEPTDETSMVEFAIFDFWNPLLTMDFGQRFQTLKHSALPLTIACSLCNNYSQIDEIFEHYITQGYEGIVIIQGSAPYVNDAHSKYKLKMKLFKDEEFRCIGVEKGTGKYLNCLGALRCETNEGKLFSVGTGFTNDERKKFFLLHDKFLIDAIVSVKHYGYSEDGIPLNPVFLAIRNYE